MTKKTLSLALLLPLLGACGSPTPMDMPDAAAPMSDAGPPDTGVPLCATITTLQSLPASCLPRCAAATFASYRACHDAPCIMSTLAADTTPPVTLGTASGNLTIGCGPGPGVDWACVQWQSYVVFAALCPGDYTMLLNCQQSGGSCQTENDTLAACAQADPGFGAMFVNLVSMCFATS